MDSDSGTTRLSAAFRRYNHSRSDPYNGGGDINGGDDRSRPQFLCPFCAEDFDVVGLCCHIDEEHAIEAKNGVCPVCAKRVGMDLVGHITMQHGSLLKVQRKRRFRKGGSNLTLPMLRKEMREGQLQSLVGRSQYLVSSSNTEPDPLLLSFIYHLPMDGEPVGVKSVAARSVKDNSIEDTSKSITQQSPLSEKDQEERTRKCKFVQGLLLSTFLDDKFMSFSKSSS